MALPKSRGDREYQKFTEDISGDVAIRIVAEDALPVSGGGSGGGSNTYSNSSNDFIATANTGAKTITITNLSFTLEAKHVAAGSVKVIDSSGNVTNVPLTSVAVSSGVITLADKDSNFSSGDVVVVSLIGPDKGYDSDLDTDKSTVQNPAWSRETSSEAILSAAQTMTTTVADVGSEIDVREYKTLTLYMTTTIQQATNFSIAFMGKHESAGSEEMPLDDGFVTIAGTTVAAPSTAAIYYFEQTEDVNADWVIKINVEGIAFIQVRAYEGADGGTDATIDTLDAIKQY